jgi:hypothetical protein
MTVLQADIAAFDRLRGQLEVEHRGDWVVFHEATFVGVYDSFDAAASEAVERSGAGPYLIRQVGAEAIPLGAGMVFRPAYAHGPGGV